MPCIECKRGFHGVCDPDGNCCCSATGDSDIQVSIQGESTGGSEPDDLGISDKGLSTSSGHKSGPGKVNPAYDTSDPEADWRVSSGNTKRGKRDAALKDQQSTGRKRAAKLYPLYRDEFCEWRDKTRQGGGTKPIQGCSDGLQQSRHHGPDKNTLNNEEGNVHRICHGCHNRWHSANDPDYVPGKPVTD